MKFLTTLAIAAMMLPPVWGVAFMGQDISSLSNECNSMLVMRQCWKQDIEASRTNDTLCTLSEEVLGPIYAALDAYVQAATEAHAALVNFAVYSMKPLRQAEPERCRKAMEQYKRALNILFIRDMEQLRLTSVLSPADRIEGLQPEADALSEAMQKRIYQNFDTFRNARVEYYEHRSELHKQRVAFIFNLLAGDRPACEFITNTPLENAPDNYTANCAARFQAAYAAWQKYADCAVRMHCPAPSLQGNSTPDAKAAMQLMLQKHFEQFLTLLTGGLGR